MPDDSDEENLNEEERNARAHKADRIRRMLAAHRSVKINE